MIKNVYWSVCKVTVKIVIFQWKFNFMIRFSKYSQISDSTKICTLEA